MPKSRVLIVDDSVVFRKILTDIISIEPDFEVVGTASNGVLALMRIPQYNPDIITLDIEMPEMDGLACLVQIRKLYPKLPVIMFSSLTSKGAAATLDALALGASDYVGKPSTSGGYEEAKEIVRLELVRKIRSILKLHNIHDYSVSTRIHTASSITLESTPKETAPKKDLAQVVTQMSNLHPSIPKLGPFPRGSGIVKAIAIGVSTGGPNALGELLPLLPDNLGVPVLIVQHMPPIFTKLLAERLSTKTKFPICEAAEGDLVIPGKGYLAPGDFHMAFEKNGKEIKIQLNKENPENSCRPSVDVMFRSLVKTWEGNVLTIILTGMGQDGYHGSQVVREAGGQVLAQDEASSVVWGMPGFVVKSGLADKVLPLDEIAAEIIKRVRMGGN